MNICLRQRLGHDNFNVMTFLGICRFINFKLKEFRRLISFTDDRIEIASRKQKIESIFFGFHNGETAVFVLIVYIVNGYRGSLRKAIKGHWNSRCS